MRNLLVLICFLALVACSRPDPVLHDTHGHTVQLSALKGKWVVINFWAIWCEACVEETPQLNLFYQHAKKDIAFYGASFDAMPPDTLKQAVKKMEIDYPVIIEDAKKEWMLDEIDVLPTTIIIDPDGKIVAKLEGGLMEGSLMQKLKDLQAARH